MDKVYKEHSDRKFEYYIPRGQFMVNREKRFESDTRQIISRFVWHYPLTYYIDTVEPASIDDRPESV